MQLERAEKAELLNKPLQDKIEKLMKKIDHFTASKSTMERKMDTLSRENVDLVRQQSVHRMPPGCEPACILIFYIPQ